MSARIALPMLALGLAVAPPAGAAVTQVAAQWEVHQVGPHQRSLELLWQGGGCDQPGDAKATVSETGRAVLIDVRKDVNPTDVVCPAIAFIAPLTVKLQHPLRGRLIYGRPRSPASAWLTPQPGRADGRRFVPRLIGFASRDARRALAIAADPARFVTHHHRGGRVRVASQSPRPGFTLAPDGTVQVQFDGGRASGA